jgi:hypothetical protein
MTIEELETRVRRLEQFHRAMGSSDDVADAVVAAVKAATTPLAARIAELERRLGSEEAAIETVRRFNRELERT